LPGPASRRWSRCRPTPPWTAWWSTSGSRWRSANIPASRSRWTETGACWSPPTRAGGGRPAGSSRRFPSGDFLRLHRDEVLVGRAGALPREQARRTGRLDGSGLVVREVEDGVAVHEDRQVHRPRPAHHQLELVRAGGLRRRRREVRVDPPVGAREVHRAVRVERVERPVDPGDEHRPAGDDGVADRPSLVYRPLHREAARLVDRQGFGRVARAREVVPVKRPVTGPGRGPPELPPPPPPNRSNASRSPPRPPPRRGAPCNTGASGCGGITSRRAR